MNQKILKQYIFKKQQMDSITQSVPYGWYKLREELPIKWMPYSQYLNGHARELANTINEFGQHINSLLAWEKVLKDCDPKEKHTILFEFVSPLTTLTLNMPYIIRSRFIYSITHLSHQANQLNQEAWGDDLCSNNEIYFDTADKYGKPWKKYNKLKLALEKIADKKYVQSTHDFRNKYNHRYSPAIEIGLTELVTRTLGENGSIIYGLGSTPPLMLRDIIPLLKTHHTHCMSSFSKYQALVNEQVEQINNCVTSSP